MYGYKTWQPQRPCLNDQIFKVDLNLAFIDNVKNEKVLWRANMPHLQEMVVEKRFIFTEHLLRMSPREFKNGRYWMESKNRGRSRAIWLSPLRNLSLNALFTRYGKD